MRFIDTNQFHINEPTALSIGKFDTLHRGHQVLIRDCKQAEKDKNLLSTVLSLYKEREEEVYSVEEKRILANHLGVSQYISFPFTKEVMSMSREDFVRNVVVKQCNAKQVVVGVDFRFGYHREGDVEYLRQVGAEFGIDVIVKEKETYEGEVISSSRVRAELYYGKMETVHALLGYPYFVYGEIVHGKELGRRMGVPTINIAQKTNKLLPPYGVYASKVTIQGKTYDGVTNIGKKPTVTDGKQVTVETHLFDFKEQVYGEMAQTSLLSMIRKEQTFSSMEELSSQMHRDGLRAKQILSGIKW